MQVSAGGGRIPFWSRNGHELRYRTDDQRIMAATYTTRVGSFVVQKLRQWPHSRLADAGVLANLDLAPDGQRMVVLAPATNPDDRQAGNHATFMLNF